MPGGEHLPPFSETDLDDLGEIITWKEYWPEGLRGIIGMTGRIDMPLYDTLQDAADQFIKDPEVVRLVFDFEQATYINQQMMKILVDAHRNTVQGRLSVKEMSLR